MKKQKVLNIEKDHAELSASGSERWLNCSPSVALIREAPVQEDSKWSLEGTTAHSFLEQWLESILYEEPFRQLKELKKNKDMYDAVKRAVEFVIEEWDESKQTLLIEERISLEYIGPDMFGTCDITIVEKGKHLQIWDYKHGIGKAVDVSKPGLFGTDHNTQLIYYALGMAHRYNYKFNKVTIGVLQPRAKHKLGWKRSNTLSMSELRKYEHIFRKGVERVTRGTGRLEVGEWCYWCPARTFNCPKQEQMKYEKASDMFGDIE